MHDLSINIFKTTNVFNTKKNQNRCKIKLLPWRTADVLVDSKQSAVFNPKEQKKNRETFVYKYDEAWGRSFDEFLFKNKNKIKG